MSEDFKIEINRSSFEEFNDFMYRNAPRYQPEYLEALNNGYARKIYDRAVRYEVFWNNRLAAILCVYINHETKEAYTTNGCIEPECQRQGLRIRYSDFVARMLDLVSKEGMTILRCETCANHHLVINSLLKVGFEIDEQNSTPEKTRMFARLQQK